jgi:(2Fe-2S) ferredoxin
MDSLAEFSGFRLRVLREKGAEDVKPCLVICAGTGGQASGSNDILRMIKRTILERKLQERISLRITGCQGFCQMDPFIVLEPGKHLYPKVKRKPSAIIDAALNGGHRDLLTGCLCPSMLRRRRDPVLPESDAGHLGDEPADRSIRIRITEHGDAIEQAALNRSTGHP